MSTLKWNKGEDGPITKNFSQRELSCRCKRKDCVEQKISLDLVNKLQKIRDELKVPLQINSAYRCVAHNKAVGGSPTSQHVLGNAADIKILIGTQIWFKTQFLKMAEKLFNGIGIYPTFIHVDVREGKARWTR